MTVLLVGAGLLVSSLLAACGEGTRADESETSARDRIDSLGSQPDAPLVPVAAVTVSERFRLGRSAHAQAGLHELLDLEIDDAGALYVLDRVDPRRMQIVKLDSSGQHAEPFGKYDNRRDRVQFTTGFEVAPWNVVLLVDRALNTLTSYLTIGTFISSIYLNGFGMNVHPLPESGHFYLHKWDPERRRSYVVFLRSPLDSLGVAYGVDIPPGQSVRQEARDVGFLTAVDGQGRLYVAFSDGYPVRVVTREGETVRLIGVDRRPVHKSSSELEAERARLEGGLRREFLDAPDSLLEEALEPDSLYPMIEELAIDPFGRLWVRTHRREITGATPYDVFNERGQFLARVSIPGEVVHTAFRADGRMFVIDAAATEAMIVGYDIALSESGTSAAIADRGDAAAGP